MKKLLIFVAVCMATAAQATILRVSNVVNSGAPYSNIPAAIEAAEEGDTIIVDGSPDPYSERTGTSGWLSINKRLVLMGPGYLLTENGVKLNGDQAVVISCDVQVVNNAAGTIIQGINLAGSQIDIRVPNVVITRCKADCQVFIATEATNCVLHQNMMTHFIGRPGYFNYKPYNAQVTNNIITREINTDTGVLRGFRESRIAYNTFTRWSTGSYVNIADVSGCTIENNIFCGQDVTATGNTILDNYVYSKSGESPMSDCTTDLEIQNVLKSDTDFPADKGAFAGDDPYVISGIPAGPTIEDITVPATIEQGGTLNVTIKLGIQK